MQAATHVSASAGAEQVSRSRAAAQLHAEGIPYLTTGNHQPLPHEGIASGVLGAARQAARLGHIGRPYYVNDFGGPVPVQPQLLMAGNNFFGSQAPVMSPVTTAAPGNGMMGPYIHPTHYPVLPVAGPSHGRDFSVGNEMEDVSRQRTSSWVTSHENGLAPGSQVGMYPNAPYGNSASIGGYVRNNLAAPFSQPPQHWQVMRAASGYIFQDLHVLVSQEPPIPPAVPAMWSNGTEMSLARALENRDGVTNVYIRGLLPDTTDELIRAYAARFGEIERCKAIVDLDTGLCKGFGFVQYFNFESCENCIRGFHYLGYQASFAQRSRNSRLKDLEDRSSTNLYCTNLPVEWTEADLRNHFAPFNVVSLKICRDEATGMSKQVGFVRFETREDADTVLNEFHNAAGTDNVKLLLRFADTKAQKQLKRESNQRRAYRAGEYSFSVEAVQRSTPASSFGRAMISRISPNSQGTNTSVPGFGSVYTPNTSVSPPGPNNGFVDRSQSTVFDPTPLGRGQFASASHGARFVEYGCSPVPGAAAANAGSFDLVATPDQGSLVRRGHVTSDKSPLSMDDTPASGDHNAVVVQGRRSRSSANRSVVAETNLAFRPRVPRMHNSVMDNVVAGASHQGVDDLTSTSLSPVSARREVVVATPRSAL